VKNGLLHRTVSAALAVAAVAAVGALGGCALGHPGMTVPSTQQTVATSEGLGVENALTCVEVTVASLRTQDDRWIATITARQPHHGLIETGNFPDDNQVGFRVRGVFHPDRHHLVLTLKGSGVYHTDLGVEAAGEQLARELAPCLDAAANPN
jgi:hypothetical protein